MKTKIFNRFESISDFNDYLNTHEVQKAFNSNEGSQQVAISGKKFAFYGTHTYEEANDNLNFGDGKLAKMLQAELLDVENQETEQEVTQTFDLDVCGFFPDVAAYLSGDPCNMVTVVDTFADKEKVLNIIWQNDADSSIKAKYIQECAARVINVILGLEKLGYKINLYYGYSAKNEDNDTVGAIIKIKNSDEYLDTLRLAYPLISASMKRRHMFRYLEKTPGVPVLFSFGYGYPAKITETYGKEVEGMKVINFGDFKDKTCGYIKDYILGQNKAF